MSIVDSIFQELCSKQKLQRDRVISQLQQEFSKYDNETYKDLIHKFNYTIAQKDLPWETYHGVLEALCYVVKQNKDLSSICNITDIQESLVGLLSHEEARVRLSAGSVLGSLCAVDEGRTYAYCKDLILNMIITNLERDFLMEGSSDGSRPCSPSSAAQIFHDTAGWRNLETSMKCLESMILGSKEHFSPYINQELLELVFTTLVHTNRFVRETGFTVCSALVLYPFPDEEYEKADSMETSTETYSMQLAINLAKGMADNWSQVRHSASVASRNFLLNISEDKREPYFPSLLPRICLNRYYVAEGVRLYSQETWQKLTGLNGRTLVQKYITNFITYYMEATKADNHAVREAACSCVAELATKIPHEAVKPFVNELLAALIISFTDDSWPVRDAACLACGNFVKCFPEESRQHLDDLTKHFFANMEDSIPSVRQGGAGALAAAVKSYGADYLTMAISRIEQNLKGIESQKNEFPESSSHVTGGVSIYGIYGVAKRNRDNDPFIHSDKQMYSCGSLAPKMSRGGCSDCKFQRPAEPWEKADGSVYLICELSAIPVCCAEVARLLPLVSGALSLRHYPAHLSLCETVCKVLPIIAKGIGKKCFKENLTSFYDHIFYALSSESDLTSTAANQCLNQISQFIGPSILMGRLEAHNPTYVRILQDRNCIPTMGLP